MKKLLILGIIILSIFTIYKTMIDKKIYYVSLGDEISLGMTNTGYYKKSYPLYIKEYLEKKNRLETFIDEYENQGYRITDLINDINNNKEIEETHKTIKNILIKADLITISIGTNDIISKLNTKDYKKLYSNIEEIINDLDKLLKLIREYCKENIILVGINIKSEDKKISEIIRYTNEKFKESADKYKIEYIDINEINNKYPTEEEYVEISNKIIEHINLLK